MIKCDLREIKEHELLSIDDKRKFGRYHGSMFWDLPGFGKKKWVIAARIDFLENLPTNVTDSVILDQCVRFLNTPPPRKKFQRRIAKPKYGSLELYSGKIIRKEEDTYISALLVTDQRNSKLFWGRGIVTAR
tara:strand:- start:1206 stop:1601 length:396 start_codon:yes stop_codon:yes gene_type:complete